MNIKEIIEKNDTKLGRTFDLCVQVLIFISIISFSIETLPNLNGDTRRFLEITEIIILTNGKPPALLE